MTEKKDDVISTELPCIYRMKKKIGASGYVIEEEQTTIKGKTLNEVKKVFDEVSKSDIK